MTVIIAKNTATAYTLDGIGYGEGHETSGGYEVDARYLDGYASVTAPYSTSDAVTPWEETGDIWIRGDDARSGWRITKYFNP